MDQKGSTMIEALSALMIFTVLGIAGMKLIGSLFDMFKQNIVVGEIKDIRKSVADRFSANGEYSELKNMTTADIVKEKMVPNQMVANGKIYNKIGGEVEIKVSSLDTIYFDVTFKGLTNRSCLNLSQINWVVNQNSDLIQLKVNDKLFQLPFGSISPSAANALPMTVAKASSVCNKGGTNNVITWTFQ